jgi:hypothetical protein
MAAWVVMIFLTASREAAAIPVDTQISLAEKHGRVWVYALVDLLAETNLSSQEKKEIYHLLLEQELQLVGLVEVDAMMAVHERKAKVYEAKLQPELFAKIFSNLRLPYEKPLFSDKELALTAAERETIERFFIKHLYGEFAKRPRTAADLIAMPLGTIVMGSLKSTLDTWIAQKGIVAVSSKTHEAVEKSFNATIERLSADEAMINEAWKFAASRKFGE